MKKLAFLAFFISLGVATLATARADDQTAAVQQQLKDQGFYYGQVDGQPGPETTAAIRRYQIRNGLPVDGNLNKETLDSMKIAGAPSTGQVPKPAPLDTQTREPQQPQQAQQQPAPAPNDLSESDREFLSKQESASNAPAQAAATPTPAHAPAPHPVASTNLTDSTNPNPTNPRVISPPVDIQSPDDAQDVTPQAPPLAAQYAILFARTPYQNAPFELQQITVRNAQSELAHQTYYNGEVDGIPGPMTARAITTFQANGGLDQTGRLDLPTLAALRLLPNQNPGAVPVRRVIIQPFYPPPRIILQPRRGVWVD